MFKKLGIALFVGGTVVAVAHSQEVPFDFQLLWAIFAMIGAVVFMMLDAPSLKAMNGGKSLVAVVGFWLVVITVCIAGASLLPQFDPEDERGENQQAVGKAAGCLRAREGGGINCSRQGP